MQHRVRFSIEGGVGTFVTALPCPFDPADEDRPCWPHDEDDEPLPAPQPDCTYVGWIESVGMECMGTFTFDAPIVGEWDGDYPTFEKGVEA